ncbi:aminotransferase class I/II-fold pyridoxal phosphate-dependent enzyme [bacterium]|nr:aminotransferase class I/II-fold pyridoxal phosphate-dependent enzyme [bacterium]
MHVDIFQLERIQSLWENSVAYNLTETGIHPFTLKELLPGDELQRLLDLRLGYGHTNGSPALRDAVSALYTGADRENILVTAGSIEANFIAVWSLLEPGDELVLMLPNYMQIWGAARAFGITVKPFYLREESGWQFDPDELRRALTPKTKMIAVCNPDNPTGAVMSSGNMDLIVRLARERDIWIYADEIYRGAELSGEETPSFYGRWEKTMVAGGLSKAYALAGLRIGWLAGPKPAIEAAWAHRDYTTISTVILSNEVAAWALGPGVRQRILQRNRSILETNLALIHEWAASQGDLFSFHDPAAGGMVFLRYDLPVNSTALSEKIRREKSTFIIPGDCFDMDGYIRIGIGAETSYLRAGLERVAAVLNELRG